VGKNKTLKKWKKGEKEQQCGKREKGHSVILEKWDAIQKDISNAQEMEKQGGHKCWGKEKRGEN